jgi:hypothetical protein
MAIIVKDRVQETTTTTGVTDFVLGGAVGGFQSFSSIGNTNSTYYTAVDSTTNEWEVGFGTYSTVGPTLIRTTVLSSSSSGSKVAFASGTKVVFVTYPAGRAIYVDEANTTTLAGLADVALGNAFLSGGAGANPFWGKIGLTTHVSGVLPVINGGTGNTTGSAQNLAGGGAGQIPYNTAASTTDFTATGTVGQVLTSAGTSAPVWSGINGGTF